MAVAGLPLVRPCKGEYAAVICLPPFFDDEEGYPFRDVFFDEDPYPEDQGPLFDDPEDRMEEPPSWRDFAWLVGDVSQKLPHQVGLTG